MNTDIKALWDDLHGELFKFIVTRVRNEDDSKDILHDVFIKMNARIDTLRNPSSLTSWTYQITRNTITDYFRAQQSHKELPIDALDLPENENDDHVYQRLSTCINGKIAALSQTYQEAIILTSFNDFTQKQLAEAKNISHSGAKSRVQRAKDMLKEDILDCPNVVKDSHGNIIDYLK